MGDSNSSLLAEIEAMNGFLGGALVDIESGQCLTTYGSGNIDLSRVAESHATLFRAQLRVLMETGWNDNLEDVHLILTRQIHILCFIPEKDSLGLFLLAVLDRAQAKPCAAFDLLSEKAASFQLNEAELVQLDTLRNPFSGYFTGEQLDDLDDSELKFKTPFMSEKAVMSLLEV